MTTYEVSVNRKPYKVKVLKGNGTTFHVKINEKTVTAEIESPSQDNAATIRINGKSLQAKIENIHRNLLQVRIDGRSFKVQRQINVQKKTGFKLEPSTVLVERPAVSSKISPSKKDAVTAPIAGRIILLKVNVGQKVEKGDCICVLEAMKMENEITASKKGLVKEIKVSSGAIVNRGDILAILN